jgi:hypothetical protein
MGAANGLLSQRVPVLAFVNNHFAGYAPETIRQLLAALGAAAEMTVQLRVSPLLDLDHLWPTLLRLSFSCVS